MKYSKYVVLGSLVMCASMMVACADQKGFKARITTPEDVIRIKAEMAKKAGKTVEPETSEGGSSDLVVPPRDANKAVPDVNLGDGDRSTGSDFAEIAIRQHKEQEAAAAAALAAKNAAGKGATKPDQAEAAKIAEAQRIALKLKEITEAISPTTAELIKGLQITYKDEGSATSKPEEARFVVALDMLLAVGEREVLVTGAAKLSVQDQIATSRLVEVKVTAMDVLTNELKLKGVEAYAACAVEACNEVQIMVLITRADGSKASMVGKFAADGKSLGTTLGDQLRTVKEAQDLSVKAREEAEKVEAARLAAQADLDRANGAGSGGQSAGGKQQGKGAATFTGERDQAVINAQVIDFETEQQVIRHAGDDKKPVEQRFMGFDDIAKKEAWEKIHGKPKMLQKETSSFEADTAKRKADLISNKTILQIQGQPIVPRSASVRQGAAAIPTEAEEAQFKAGTLKAAVAQIPGKDPNDPHHAPPAIVELTFQQRVNRWINININGYTAAELDKKK